MCKSTNSQDYSSKNDQASSAPTLFNLSDFRKKEVEVHFTAEQISHDGGLLLLLNEVEKQIGLISKLARCIDDTRHQGYVQHSVDSMLKQRIMQIAAGYEDANDCNTLKNDAILKICAGQEQPLSTQPTMCRFENSISPREAYEMTKVFIDNFIGSYDVAPEFIILDSDDTNAITHGQQELTLFNSYCGDYCYMPLHIYEGMSGELITTILKPGRRSKSINVFSIMKKLINYLGEYWPNTMIILRGDSHFCSKEFMDWSEDINNVEFITGIADNQTLNRLAEITIASTEREYKRSLAFESFQKTINSPLQPNRMVSD
ncbi:MAG: IS1380 family transposase [Crocinitomix sp.]|nr:IS1380 family transposase [Crocinitomix sp.]